MTLTLTGTKLILGSQGLIDLTNNPIPCFFDDLDSTPLGSEFLSAHTPDVDFSGTGWVDLGDQGNAGSDDWLVTNGGSAFIGDGTRDYAANAAAVPSIIRGRWIGQPGSTIYLLWRAPTTVDVSDGTPAGSGDTAPCFKVRLFVDPGGTTLSAALLDNTGSTMDSIVIPVSAPFDISFSIVDDGSNINVVGSFGLALSGVAVSLYGSTFFGISTDRSNAQPDDELQFFEVCTAGAPSNLQAPDTSLPVVPPATDLNDTPSFTMRATEGSAPVKGFEYRVDGGSWTFITAVGSAPNYDTPVIVGPLSVGPHTFESRAIDDTNIADPNPVSYPWTIADVQYRDFVEATADYFWPYSNNPPFNFFSIGLNTPTDMRRTGDTVFDNAVSPMVPDPFTGSQKMGAVSSGQMRVDTSSATLVQLGRSGNGYSIGFWMQITPVAGTAFLCQFSRVSASATTRDGVSIRLTTGNQITTQIAPIDSIQSTVPAPTGVPFYFVYTFDGVSTHNIYIDGVLVDTFGLAYTLTTSANKIYDALSNRELFHGDLEIYDGVLSLEDIQDRHQFGSGQGLQILDPMEVAIATPITSYAGTLVNLTGNDYTFDTSVVLDGLAGSGSEGTVQPAVGSSD